MYHLSRSHYFAHDRLAARKLRDAKRCKGNFFICDTPKSELLRCFQPGWAQARRGSGIWTPGSTPSSPAAKCPKLVSRAGHTGFVKLMSTPQLFQTFLFMAQLPLRINVSVAKKARSGVEEMGTKPEEEEEEEEEGEEEEEEEEKEEEQEEEKEEVLETDMMDRDDIELQEIEQLEDDLDAEEKACKASKRKIKETEQKLATEVEMCKQQDTLCLCNLHDDTVAVTWTFQIGQQPCSSQWHTVTHSDIRWHTVTYGNMHLSSALHTSGLPSCSFQCFPGAEIEASPARAKRICPNKDPAIGSWKRGIEIGKMFGHLCNCFLTWCILGNICDAASLFQIEVSLCRFRLLCRLAGCGSNWRTPRLQVDKSRRERKSSSLISSFDSQNESVCCRRHTARYFTWRKMFTSILRQEFRLASMTAAMHDEVRKTLLTPWARIQFDSITEMLYEFWPDGLVLYGLNVVLVVS